MECRKSDQSDKVKGSEPVCKIARAKGLDAFGITEFDITMAINVSKFHLFYNLRS